MSFTTLTDDLNVIQALDDQPNDTGGLTAEQVKAKFDEAANAIKTYINNTLIAELQSIEEGSSGADNMGATAIPDIDGVTVQALLESIRDKLKSTADGSSGADFVSATAIDGLTGETTQSLLEALKTLIDTHKTSSDHDSRYYTETEIESLISVANGAIATLNSIANAGGNINLVGGTGISVSNNAGAKTITLTATGESYPAPHAETHKTGGLDELTPADIGAVPSSHLTEKASSYQLGHVTVDDNTIIADDGVITALPVQAIGGWDGAVLDGCVIVDNKVVVASGIDTISQMADNNTFDIYGNIYCGQSFVPSGGMLSSIQIKSMTKVGTPTGNVVLTVCEDNSDKPGSVMATVSRPVSDFSAYTFYEFILSTPETVANRKYWFYISLPSGNSSNFLRISTQNTNVYANGNRATTSNGGISWTNQSDDMTFIVEGGGALAEGTFSLDLTPSNLQSYVNILYNTVIPETPGTQTVEVDVKDPVDVVVADSLVIADGDRSTQTFDALAGSFTALNDIPNRARVLIALEEFGAPPGALNISLYNKSGSNPGASIGTTTIPVGSGPSPMRDTEIIIDLTTPVSINDELYVHVAPQGGASGDAYKVWRWGHKTGTSGGLVLSSGTWYPVETFRFAVYDDEGITLLSDVQNKDSLSSINPTTYPSIRIMGTLTRASTGDDSPQVGPPIISYIGTPGGE